MVGMIDDGGPLVRPFRIANRSDSPRFSIIQERLFPGP